MRRGLFGVLLAAIVVATVTILPFRSTGGQINPVAAPGLLDAVRRDFEVASDAFDSVDLVIARVAEFDTAQHASDAITPWIEQVRAYDGYNYDLSGLRPVAVAQIADESRGYVATVPNKDPELDSTYEVAALAIRDGAVLYTLEGSERETSPLDELVAIAERTLGLRPLELAPVLGVPYHTGGLWDLLPKIEHMPEGMTWEEEVLICSGVFGANPCPEATPEAGATPIGSPEASVAATPIETHEASPTASPTPQQSDQSLAHSPGVTVVSGDAGQTVSEAFSLTDGNWFVRVEATGQGRISIRAIQIGGTGIEYLVSGEALPYVASGAFTIYDSLGYAGDYVLSVESDGPWTVTLSQIQSPRW